jgi:GTP 3',8-cyclase
MTYPIKLDTLLIELADFCNLNCIMCDMSKEGRIRHGHLNPQFPVHSTKGNFLSFHSFRKIIDSINSSSIKINQLSLFWLGEPMINPDIDLMLDYLNRNMTNIDGWLLHTNANLINDSTLKLLFNSDGNNILHFSIDAYSEEVYNKVRRGGDLNKVISNIQKALDLKEINPKLKLVLQFIIMDENKHEAKDFVDFWSKEFSKRNLPFVVASKYSEHSENTIFLRQEITTKEKQSDADLLHKDVSKDIL